MSFPAIPSLQQRLRTAQASLRAERVSLQDLAACHGPAAQGAWLVLLALPCVLPLPGAGTVLGLGLMVMAWRMLLGQDLARLPERIGRYELSQAHAHTVLSALTRFHDVAGRRCRTRLTGLVEHLERSSRLAWAPVMVGLMAVLIVLPIPFGNVLPAVAVAMLGLGLVHRDGLMVALSTLMALLATAYAAGLGVSVWLLGGQWLSGIGWV